MHFTQLVVLTLLFRERDKLIYFYVFANLLLSYFNLLSVVPFGVVLLMFKSQFVLLSSQELQI